jgi:hypothetical protein
MTSLKNRILEHLTPVVGLSLSIARRAADMRVFHFGKVSEVAGGSVGEIALHIQCPWRIEGREGVVTGRSDLWVPSRELQAREPELDLTKWKYDFGNLQDEKMGHFLGGYDVATRSAVNRKGGLIVQAVAADDLGGATIFLSGDYRVVIFPAGTTAEEWRIFRPGEGDHFVVDHESS